MERTASLQTSRSATHSECRRSSSISSNCRKDACRRWALPGTRGRKMRAASAGLRSIPNAPDTPGDPLHWTGIDQNWNYQCAFCHATNLKKNYDPHSDSFHTAWSELSVGCEACHGPASRHVAWASKQETGERSDDPIKDLPPAWMSERASRGRCRRVEPPFVQSPARPTRKSKRALFAMPGDSSSRMKDKSFSTRSVPHCFSRTSITPMDSSATRFTPTPRSCRAACTLRASPASDCHNPHTQKLRAPGNAVCAQCHAPATFDTSAHHHHAAGSKGSECAACHMPTTNYMVVDPRHDHSMRIPRPDRTLSLGTPNACNQCHADKTPSWASEAIKSWYPSPKLGYQSFAEAFDLADRAAPGAQAALTKIVEDTSQSTIARASAHCSPRTVLVAEVAGRHCAGA